MLGISSYKGGRSVPPLLLGVSMGELGRCPFCPVPPSRNWMCVVGRVLPTLGLGFLCCLMYKQTTNTDSIITAGMRISTITNVIVKTVL